MKSYKCPVDLDERFRLKRERLRQEDQELLASGQMTAKELQRRNSIFPANLHEIVTIDWAALAYGKK